MNTQTKTALREWFYSNRVFFHLSLIALHCDVDVTDFHRWVERDEHEPRERQFPALLEWALEHGFGGKLVPVEARFTADEHYHKDEVAMKIIKEQAAEKIGRHLLEHGFLTFEEMGDVSKPDAFRRTYGFRLFTNALKPPTNEPKTILRPLARNPTEASRD
jgi:hypothetical protein